MTDSHIKAHIENHGTTIQSLSMFINRFYRPLVGKINYVITDGPHIEIQGEFLSENSTIIFNRIKGGGGAHFTCVFVSDEGHGVYFDSTNLTECHSDIVKLYAEDSVTVFEPSLFLSNDLQLDPDNHLCGFYCAAFLVYMEENKKYYADVGDLDSVTTIYLRLMLTFNTMFYGKSISESVSILDAFF
jgi:hypothetical protein